MARSRKPGFAERYERFLTAGGSASPEEGLAVFGVDLGDPEIRNDGFAVLERFVEAFDTGGAVRARLRSAPAHTPPLWGQLRMWQLSQRLQ